MNDDEEKINIDFDLDLDGDPNEDLEIPKEEEQIENASRVPALDVGDYSEENQRRRQEKREHEDELRRTLEQQEDELTNLRNQLQSKEVSENHYAQALHDKNKAEIESEYKKAQNLIEQLKESKKVFASHYARNPDNDELLDKQMEVDQEIIEQRLYMNSLKGQYDTLLARAPTKVEASIANKADLEAKYKNISLVEKNFLKQHPYLDPRTEHYSKNLENKAAEIMVEVEDRWKFEGKTKNLYSEDFYKDVSKALTNSAGMRDDRRPSNNNSSTGVFRTGSFMNNSNNKNKNTPFEQALNADFRKLIDSYQLRADSNGNVMTKEQKNAVMQKVYQEWRKKKQGY